MNKLLPLLLLICLAFSLPGCAGSPAAQGAPVALHYEEGAQVELIDSNGARVMFDVVNPGELTGEPAEKDILLVTHGHSDHLNRGFVDAFPGKVINGQPLRGREMGRGLQRQTADPQQSRAARKNHHPIYG